MSQVRRGGSSIQAIGAGVRMVGRCSSPTQQSVRLCQRLPCCVTPQLARVCSVWSAADAYANWNPPVLPPPLPRCSLQWAATCLTCAWTLWRHVATSSSSGPCRRCAPAAAKLGGAGGRVVTLGAKTAAGHVMRVLAHMWKSACASLGSARRSPTFPASCGTLTSVQYAGGWEARAYRGIAEKLLWKSATLQVIEASVRTTHLCFPCVQASMAAWCVVRHAVTLPEYSTVRSSPISLLIPHPHPHPPRPPLRRRPPSPRASSCCTTPATGGGT